VSGVAGRDPELSDHYFVPEKLTEMEAEWLRFALASYVGEERVDIVRATLGRGDD
jgi:hypothetical protein